MVTLCHPHTFSSLNLSWNRPKGKPARCSRSLPFPLSNTKDWRTALVPTNENKSRPIIQYQWTSPPSTMSTAGTLHHTFLPTNVEIIAEQKEFQFPFSFRTASPTRPHFNAEGPTSLSNSPLRLKLAQVLTYLWSHRQAIFKPKGKGVWMLGKVERPNCFVSIPVSSP